MRKLFIASVAVLALSTAARADNTATTLQFGVVNASAVNQQGVVNDSSFTGQVGIVNASSTMQGTTTPSLNNASTTIQIGAVNAASTGQVGFLNNSSSITQQSIGGPPANAAAVLQISGFGVNASSITQH